jgi:hypothetical protein
MLSTAVFLVRLKQRAPRRHAFSRPLEAAEAFIATNGDTGEGRALASVLTTLRTGAGAY